MYWQVYLHKTVLGTEQLIINILKRAKFLAQQGRGLFATPALTFFLYEQISGADFSEHKELLPLFCNMDDADIMSAIKVWAAHEDDILSHLCKMLLNRKLYKVRLSSQPQDEEFEALRKQVLKKPVSEEALPYLLHSGTTSNSTYNQNDEQIHILLKSGNLLPISQMDNALINSLVAGNIRKYYYYYDPSLLSAE
jgi:HD superfamily phosphohydrolase